MGRMTWKEYLILFVIIPIFGCIFLKQYLKKRIFSMKFFNSLQVTGLFAGAPFLMNWLTTNPFPFAKTAFWVACVVYVVAFVGMTVSVHDSMRKDGPLDF